MQADINLLTEFGIDIICSHSTQNQYNIGERIFEIPEVKLLLDAVKSARFITVKKSKTLIKKLSSFVRDPQADIFKRQLYVDHRLKAENESIYFTVDLIHQAIRLKKRVTFQYYYYTPNKKKELKHNGKVYIFSPFALIWNDDRYYVIGYSDSHQKIVKFRMDQIYGMKISKKFAVRKPEGFKMSDYFSQVFSMYEGTESKIILLYENELMTYVIDRFGESVPVIPADEDHFSSIVKVSLSQTFYGWVFSFGGRMMIQAPQEAVDAFQKFLQ
ncbi:MAG: WYL domain-containing protein [Clostridiales bacterium]|nr:WYL domain-containing protein [Clostridiales bacterium]